MIPYGRQDISAEDIRAVEEVLRSDYLTQGPTVPKFEQAFCRYVNAEHSVATNSATSALHIACLALGLSSSDTLWTSPNTFVASANCARYCDAAVDFVDIDPHTRNMCVAALEKKLISAKEKGTIPKIVVPVHFSGQSCDMKKIHELSKRYGFYVIEDASHAIGANYDEARVGSCKYSDITVFSFHPVKIITTGEGGLATTNNPSLAEKMDLFRSHGITRNLAQMVMPVDEPWYYEQSVLGLNYRMTELQAALGISQLNKLEHYIKERIKLAKRYDKLLQNLDLQLPLITDEHPSSWHLYTVLVQDHATRNSVFRYMRSKEVGVNVHYIPVHLQPYYRSLGFKEGMFPQAEKHGLQALTLPLHPKLSVGQQDYVADTLKKALC